MDVSYSQDDRGRRHFHFVYVDNIAWGTYTFFVGGIPRASLTGRGNGVSVWTVTFEDYPEPDELPLTFNPLGQFIELKKDGVTLFARAFPTTD